MFRQTLIEVGIVGVQKVKHAAVFAHDALKEELGLALESLSQIVVEVEQQFRAGPKLRHIADVKPLPGEILDERPRLRVVEHPLDLSRQHGRIVKHLVGRGGQQIVVRDAAP